MGSHNEVSNSGVQSFRTLESGASIEFVRWMSIEHPNRDSINKAHWMMQSNVLTRPLVWVWNIVNLGEKHPKLHCGLAHSVDYDPYMNFIVTTITVATAAQSRTQQSQANKWLLSGFFLKWSKTSFNWILSNEIERKFQRTLSRECRTLIVAFHWIALSRVLSES